MVARFPHAAFLAATVLLLGASHRTQNFVVDADTPQLAKEIGAAAEGYRKTLAKEWFGKEFQAWGEPCRIIAEISPKKGAGGNTSFVFDSGLVFGWQMSIQGPRERVLESVLPHEVTHTLFATHFGQPVPRWVDEGVSTTVESQRERKEQDRLLQAYLKEGRHIALHQLFALREYPKDVLPMYCQGYSVTQFLLGQGGKRKFVQFVGDGMQSNNWSFATRKHYGYATLPALQLDWLDSLAEKVEE